MGNLGVEDKNMNKRFDPKQEASHEISCRGLKLTERQTEIHRNLKAIGPEIAAYYLDGIRILQDKNLKTAASLLAHVAREIDGGLRNILSIEKKEELKFVILMPNGETLTEEKRKGDTIEFVVDTPGKVKVHYSQIGKHKPSILESLGVDEPSPLAERWTEVTGRFYKFVHRRGAWKLPHSMESFEPIWREFEDVLASLVGSYLNLLSKVVDRILEYEKPTEEIRGVLPNLLQSEARCKYFFSKLESAVWLEPLKDDGWFDPENNPPPQKNLNQGGYYSLWHTLEYVEKIADCIEKHPCDETVSCLVSIVDPIINYTDERWERIRNDYIDWRILRIIGTFPIAQIKRQHITFMDTALKSSWPRMLAAREVTQTILPKLLDADAKELTLALLKVIIDAQSTNDRIIADMGRPQLKEALDKHAQDLIILCGHDTVAAAKQKCDQIDTEKIEQFWIKSNPDEISDPIEICSDMSNTQIAEYLNGFNGQINWSGQYGARLGETLKGCVGVNPQRFANNLQPFEEIHNLYQYFIFLGFARAWRDKKEFDWAKVLAFINRIFSSKQFWLQQQDTDLDYRNLIFSAIADLLTSGTENKANAFDVQLLPLVEKLLLILVENAQPSVATLRNFPTTTIENSAKAKVFTAMVSYSLQFARVNSAEQGIRWSQAFKDDFTKRLDPNVESFCEFSFALGRYLSYLSYLDQEWVVSNINHIFSQKNEDRWQAAFSGYLLSPQIDQSLYKLIKANGHYRKALNTDSADKQRVRTLVNHICIGWIKEWETLGDEESLIYQLVNSKNPDFLSALVHFFFRHRSNLSEKAKSKVKPAWGALFEVLSQNSGVAEYQPILGSLSEWLSLIDVIDAEVLKWVKLSIKYVDRSPQPVNLEAFIQALLKNASKMPEEVGEIYLGIPENLLSRLWPGIPEITQTVEILYNRQHKKIADAVCNRFGEVGLDFLKELYEEYQR